MNNFYEYIIETAMDCGETYTPQHDDFTQYEPTFESNEEFDKRFERTETIHYHITWNWS